MKKLVVVIPTYNEAENIENTVKTLNRILSPLTDCDSHILITDANSPDKTADVVRKLILNMSNVHLIVEKTKRGLGAAYRDAMEYAFNIMQADAIICFDADLSHDPKVLPTFIDKFKRGDGFICGTRYTKGGGVPEEWGLHRKILSYCGNLFVRLLYMKSGISDFTSGYKLISKNVYDKVKDKIKNHNGYTFSIALNLEGLKSGTKVSEVPYHFSERKLGKSKMGKEYFYNALKFVLISKFNDVLNSRFRKVFAAGGIGAVVQFLTFGLIFRPILEGPQFPFFPNTLEILGYEILHVRGLFAVFLSIEIGVLCAFLINNLWAFGDHRLFGAKLIISYLKNHLVVSGAVLIQLGNFYVLSLLFSRGFFLDYIYQTIGILLGLIWNFYFYKKFIWRIKS